MHLWELLGAVVKKLASVMGTKGTIKMTKLKKSLMFYNCDVPRYIKKVVETRIYQLKTLNWSVQSSFEVRFCHHCGFVPRQTTKTSKTKIHKCSQKHGVKDMKAMIYQLKTISSLAF